MSAFIMNGARGKKGYGLRSVLLTTALSVVTFPAFAQPAGSSFGVEEIVVTALKRSTNLQETPISISAVGGDSLSKMGATGISDYVKAVPGLSLVDAGPGSRRLVIRGVQGAGEAQVGLYYDETPVTGSPGSSNDSGQRQPDLRLFDVERLEVLRGPQGTLYGGGSMGGTVRVLFKKPDLGEYEGAVDGTIQSTEHGGMGYKINGMVNVPLVSDKLAARAVLYYDDQAGYVDNIRLGQKDVNYDKTWGGRFLARLKAADNLTIDASAHIQRTDAHSNSWVDSLDGPYLSNFQSAAPIIDNSEIYNVTVNWDIDFATVTAVSSYYNRTTSITSDTSTFIGGLKTAGNCAAFTQVATCTAPQQQAFDDYVNGFVPSSLYYDPQDVNNWTNELRVGSNGESALHWTVGAFFENRKSHIVSAQYLTDPVSGLRNFPLSGNNVVTSRDISDHLKQTAVFGEASYDLTSKITLTAGTRYFDYRKEITGETTKGFALIGARVTPPTTVKSNENGWIFKFHAAYTPTDNILLYAQASEGFRPGGANQVIGLPGNLTPYKADRLWNYEIGAKTDWFDKRLVANLTGYLIDWKDMQVSGRTPNGAFAFISNAGKARIKGIEFELATYPIEGLQLTWVGSYTDAKLTEDQVNPDVNGPGKKGDRIPYVAKFTTSVAAQYNWAVSEGIHGLVRGDFNYVGASYSEFRPNNPFYERVAPHALINVRAGLEAADADWGAYLFVNNLFDKTAIVRKTSSAFGRDIVFSAMPRTYGLNLQKKF